MNNNSDNRVVVVDGVKVIESERIDLTAVGEYEVPTEPADDTQCDSCQ